MSSGRKGGRVALEAAADALLITSPVETVSWSMTPAEVATTAACFDAPSEVETVPRIAEILMEVC